MKTMTRIVLAVLVVCVVVTWSACSSDYPGTSTVYVGVGYGGYGPGWGYGWGGGYHPGYMPPPVIGPPVAVPY